MIKARTVVLFLSMAFQSTSAHERILRSGANLLSKSGLGGLTLGILAEQVDMSKSGLFAHFGSKDELQIRLLDRTAELAGRAVIALHRDDLAGSEKLAGLHLHLWKARHAGPVTSALDRAFAQWQVLQPEQRLVFDWPCAEGRIERGGDVYLIPSSAVR